MVATCTNETINGSGSRLVISQPDAALYIQVPTLATTVAVHITVNVGCRNGAHSEDACCAEDAVCMVPAVMIRSYS